MVKVPNLYHSTFDLNFFTFSYVHYVNNIDVTFVRYRYWETLSKTVSERNQ